MIVARLSGHVLAGGWFCGGHCLGTWLTRGGSEGGTHDFVRDRILDGETVERERAEDQVERPRVGMAPRHGARDGAGQVGRGVLC